MLERLTSLSRRIKRELAFFKALLQHPQTPRLAKGLLWLAMAYLAMPFDLIPDFIPILGQLDDIVILPLLVYLALKLTPMAIKQACSEQVTAQTTQ